MAMAERLKMKRRYHLCGLKVNKVLGRSLLNLVMLMGQLCSGINHFAFRQAARSSNSPLGFSLR